jgi:hypothetical protein
MQEIFDALAAPFPIEEISWRVGPTNDKSRAEGQPLRGQPLCYVDARTVMDRLDSVMGIDGWQCNYTPGVGPSIVCNIGVRIAGDWIWKGDGAGPSDNEPEKGALSDAFKRAAVRFGVGRYLYDIKAPWLELEQRGKTAFIREADHGRLRDLHDEFARRAGWGPADGLPAYRVLAGEVGAMSASAAASFLKEHATTIARMPAGMRKHLETLVAKKGGNE